MHRYPGRTLGPCLALLAGVLLSRAVAVPALRAAEWPQWRGPSRTGISPEGVGSPNWPAGGPRVLWRADVGTGFSSFAVAGGRVYTLGNRGDADTVFCLDAATGAVVWQHSYACPRQPMAYEGGPSATPAVEGGRVYTLSKSGHCFCLDAGTGAVLWSRRLDPPPTSAQDYRVWWGFAGSPLVVGGRLILPAGTAGIALDKRTGTTVWDNGPGRPGYSSPVPFGFGDRGCFALVSGHEVVAAEVDSGKILWRIPWRTTWDQNAADAIVAEGKLFVSSGHGVGCALFDLGSGAPTERWRNKEMRNELGSSVLWRGHVYGFDDNRLRCLRWDTGQVCWSAEGLGRGTLIAAGGRLLALTETGKLLVVEATPASYRLLAEAQVLTGRCWSAPALSSGRLYARNAAGSVVCLDLGGGAP